MVKQISLDTWSVQHLHDLLEKARKIITQTKVPIVLYRETLEESDEVYEEIVCPLGQDHVIPEIKQQLVFTVDEFPNRLLNKSKDLFAEVVEQLEDQFT